MFRNIFFLQKLKKYFFKNIYRLRNIFTAGLLYKTEQCILWVYSKKTKVISKNLLVKSSENDLIFSAAFYLIMCLMKAPKNFEKIVILKTWELVSFEGVKNHFGKLALKWCIFRHEKKYFLTNISCCFWSN